MAGAQRRVARTLLVFVGGVLLSIAASAIFEHLLVRDNGPLISRLYTGVPADQRSEFYQRLNHSVAVSVYVVNPLVGLTVGIFVALFEPTWTKIVAACCLIPDFAFVLVEDKTKYWSHSLTGVATFAFDHALPFIAAVLTAGFLRNVFMKRQYIRNGSATPV